MECRLITFEDITANCSVENIVEQVADIEANSFAVGWTKESISESLMESYNHLLVLEEGNLVYGYVIYNEIAGETELLRIAVSNSYRGKHFGQKLLGEYIELAGKSCERGFLEVRESNTPARKLYEKKGYENIAVRKNYYKKPDEAAIIYQIDLH